jgi:hypothetical protein
MTAEEAIEKLKTGILHVFGYDAEGNYIGSRNEAPPESKTLRPRDFLEFAIRDLESDSDVRGLVNCLTNCKRAIDAQVEQLIRRLGFAPAARRERWNIPRKLQFIEESGILAPRILKRINVIRNKLEHEFHRPSRREVEDALDVATLFVSYSELVSLPCLNWGLSDGFGVEYDFDDMRFDFVQEPRPIRSKDRVHLGISISYGEPLFDNLYEFLTQTIPRLYKGQPSGLAGD